MASTPIEGRNGRFQVNTFNANVEQFSGEVSTDRVDATGFEDQIAATGRTEQVIVDGIDKAVVNVKGFVDASQMPAGANLNLKQGSVLTNVFLYLHKTAGGGLRRLAISRALVLKVNYTVQVKDKIMFDCNIESSGVSGTPATAIVHPA